MPKRRYLYLFFIVLGAAGLVVLASWLLKSVNGTEPKVSPLLDPAKLQRYEILVLGNSQPQAAIVPDQLNRPTLNAALGGSDYAMQYAMLKHLAPRLPRLRYVMLGLDNIPLRTPAMRNRKGDYHDIAAYGVPWWDMPSVALLDRLQFGITYNSLLRPFFKGPKLDAAKIEKLGQSFAKRSPAVVAASAPVLHATVLPSPRPHPPAKSPAIVPAQPKQIAPVHQPPRVPLPGFEFIPADGARKIDVYVRGLNVSNNLPDNWAGYQGILQYCASHNLNVIFVRPPTVHSFWKNRTLSWNQELAEMESKIPRLLPRGHYAIFDEEAADGFPDWAFNDPNHLNHESAIRFSRMLCEKMAPFIR